MERLYEILMDIEPDIDYENNTRLIDDHLLNSLAIISLIAELEEEFDIVIPTVEIVAENFNSVKAMENMINRLQEEE